MVRTKKPAALIQAAASLPQANSDLKTGRPFDLQAVEDALFDTEEGSKEHKKLTARYERLKEEKKILLTQEGRPLGSHDGAADHPLKMECTADSRPVGRMS